MICMDKDLTFQHCKFCTPTQVSWTNADSLSSVHRQKQVTIGWLKAQNYTICVFVELIRRKWTSWLLMSNLNHSIVYSSKMGPQKVFTIITKWSILTHIQQYYTLQQQVKLQCIYIEVGKNHHFTFVHLHVWM